MKLRLLEADGGNPILSRQKIDLETASMGRLLHQRGAVVDQDGWTPPRGDHLAMGKPVSPARSVPIRPKVHWTKLSGEHPGPWLVASTEFTFTLRRISRASGFFLSVLACCGCVFYTAFSEGHAGSVSANPPLAASQS